MTNIVVTVAPLVGAWIEILKRVSCQRLQVVAPLVGAWIEITTILWLYRSVCVAPLVGAWIEIGIQTDTS
mgnify:CR=1 FL=1